MLSAHFNNGLAQSVFFLKKKYWLVVITILLGLGLWLIDSPLVESLNTFFFDDENSRFLSLVRTGGGGGSSIRGGDFIAEKSPQYFKQRSDSCTVQNPCTILAVADMDKASSSEDKKSFNSLIAKGIMYEDSNSAWHIEWEDEPYNISNPLNEGGRGMELSELVLFENRLYTVDDRSGVIFEITHRNEKFDVVARHIITEGDGHSSSKGMKLEWATVKDGIMFLGSFGKEYILSDGSIKNEWPMWTALLDRKGHLTRKNWTLIYNRLRELAGCPFPGYMIHEAIEWSPYHRKWLVLPRRWSDTPYDEEEDNYKATNMLIECSESFMKCDVRRIGIEGKTIENPQRGYSTLKIIPGTVDQLIVALKTEEQDAITNAGKMSSFATIFDREGNILIDDAPLPFDGKFEGIVVADILPDHFVVDSEP